MSENMDRWNALELLVFGVILSVYFVPIVSIPPRSNCVFCLVEPRCGSLTYVLLGHGGLNVGIPMSGYYSVTC